ncbi:MAG: hypothetical protein GC155_05130 [Alphaproteobacteria bacterium]|nr:hypothetical protein [Alphaproteobacteria bacterium]
MVSDGRFDAGTAWFHGPGCDFCQWTGKSSMPHPSPSLAAAVEKIRIADDLLVGRVGGAPNPETATRLYAEAVGQGSGEAAVRLAVIAAKGIACESSWPDALDLLAQAAGLSFVPAQRQLAILSGRRDLAGNQGGEKFWRKVRQDIDLESLLSAPAVETVSSAPAIMVMRGLASPAACRWIITRGRQRLSRATVFDFGTGQWVPDPIRTGLAAPFGVLDTDLVVVLTQERLARATGLMVHQQEAPFLLSYEPGQEYRAHFDFINPAIPAFKSQLELMGQRVATCLTYLNDDYEGGETDFPKIGYRFRGNTGDALLFANVTHGRAPDPSTLHAGRPPVRGTKWALSQWVRDRIQTIV